MRARQFLVILVLSCFAMALPAQAQSFRPSAKRVERQKRDNSKWEKEAKREESRLIKIADQYFKEKKYRQAEDYYRDVLDVRYKQWVFSEAVVGGEIRPVPAMRKRTARLETGNTRRARDRLRIIDEKISVLSENEAKKEIAELFEAADIEMKLKNPVKAYLIYERLIRFTSRLGKKKYAVEALLKAQGLQQNILSDAAKSLAEIEKLFKEGKVAEAAGKLEEFEATQAVFLKVSKDLQSRVKLIRRSPEMLQYELEKMAALKIKMGDAAFMRGRYVTAYERYKEVILRYPGTKAAEEARKKQVKLLGDPEIVEAMGAQRIERRCKPLIMRARALVRLKRTKEAQLICEQIVAEHPGSTWAEQAAEILAGMEKSAKEEEPPG